MKAVHSINTTVSTLHGVTAKEVVLGRPVNERSLLIASRKLNSRPKGKEGDSLPSNTENKEQIAKEPEQIILSVSEDDSRKVLGRAIRKVIKRGQERQIRSYAKK